MESRTSTAAPYSIQKPEWLVFLAALCAVAEGNVELLDGVKRTCVLTVLQDPQRRIAVLGGCDGMPRSLGSVYGGSVTRFLGGFRGGVSRAIATPTPSSCCYGVAVSRDGSALLIADTYYIGGLHMFCMHSGAFVRTIGRYGHGPLQFSYPYQVWVASDGFVFVADGGNDRIRTLTPGFDFHSFVGVGQLRNPSGVCANDDVIVASEATKHRLSVFGRSNGELLRRFGICRMGDGQLSYFRTLCFMSDHRHVAAAEYRNKRVSVWTLEGEFVRNVGVGKLAMPFGVACSDADELVIADWFNERVLVFNASNDIVWTSDSSDAGKIIGVTLHGSTILGQTGDGRCIVFT